MNMRFIGKKARTQISTTSGIVLTLVNAVIIVFLLIHNWSSLTSFSSITSPEFDPNLPIHQGQMVDNKLLEKQLNDIADAKNKAIAKQQAEEKKRKEDARQEEERKQALAEEAKRKKLEEAKKEKEEKAEQEQAAKEVADKAAKDKAAKEVADKAAKDKAAKDAADKAAKDKAAKDAADKAAADKAAKDKAAKDAADKAAKDKAAKDKAAKDAADKAAKDKAAKDAADKAAANAREAANAAANEKANQARIASALSGYAGILSDHVSKFWIADQSTRGLKVILSIQIDITGKVIGEPKVKTSSGNPFLDRQTIAAIIKSSPLPLPADILAREKVASEGILFTFTAH